MVISKSKLWICHSIKNVSSSEFKLAHYYDLGAYFLDLIVVSATFAELAVEN